MFLHRHAWRRTATRSVEPLRLERGEPEDEARLRARLLNGDERAADDLGPYARIHVTVIEAKDLLPFDTYGTSDPYVQFHVNDQLQGQRSRPAKYTLAPVWNFNTSLSVDSPHSVLRVSVMDWDRFSKDDFMGFVEFRAAELVPNGPPISGWFELRRSSELKGNALARFRRHKRTRDDEDACSLMEEQQSQEDASCPVDGRIMRDETSITETSPNKRPAGRTPSARLAAQLRRGPRCCGKTPSDDREQAMAQEPTYTPPPESVGKQRNAGEIRMVLRLETFEPVPTSPPPLPSHSWIVLMAIFRPLFLKDLGLDAEWFACCMPRPEFLPADAGIEGFSMQDVKEFWDECVDLKNTVRDNMFLPLLSMFQHVIYWRTPRLSLGMLAYWWLVCFKPALFLPSLPLLLALWLRMLRCHSFCNELLAHAMLAPLNQEGFTLLAAHDSSRIMSQWLRRVVRDRGGWVVKPQALGDFAKQVHKDGKPALTFEQLLEDLDKKSALAGVKWKVMRPKRCRDKHTLELLGSGAYRPDGNGWRCSSTTWAEGCEVDRWEKKVHAETGLHLGTRRYRCRLCNLDYCGRCAAWERKTSVFMEVPLSGRGWWRFEKMVEFKNSWEDFVYDAKENVRFALQFVERACDPADAHCNQLVDGGCAALALLLLMVHCLLHTQVAWMLKWPWEIAWAVAGTSLWLPRAAPLRRARAALRATADLQGIRELRARGGVLRWRFFTPDADDGTGAGVGAAASASSGTATASS